MMNGQIVGIGTAIIYGKTAWLAHIIVHKDYRNAGIGSAITKALIELVQHTPCATILLIATNLGEPVYKKLGFEVQTQYVFFDEGTLPAPSTELHQLSPLEDRHYDTLLNVDLAASGEHRRKLFDQHLANTTVYFENDILKGFYMPTVGEGLIIAENPVVGFELMKIRAASNQKFCVPIDNTAAVNILRGYGYQEYRRASRMFLGKRLAWDGTKLYSRIGGNLG